MDHDAVKEALELAAVEPGGLERLMAGDTPEAQAVAGHIAGCEACARRARARRSRERGGPRIDGRGAAPDLKERTLAYVLARGVPRGAAAAAAAVPVAAARLAPAPITLDRPAAAATAVASSGGARPSVLVWVARDRGRGRRCRSRRPR